MIDPEKITKQNYEGVQERTEILNGDAENKSVMDSIDRPIRPLVLELNRIGLNTYFSCCGYTYEGQEEPKSHSLNTYVLFRVQKDNPFVVESFFRLSSIAGSYSWFVHSQVNGTEWALGLNVPQEWKNQDNLSEPIHAYELKLIGITKLTEALKAFPSYEGEVFIRDGNEQRRSVYSDEWMVAPKKAVALNKIYTLKKPTQSPLDESFEDIPELPTQSPASTRHGGDMVVRVGKRKSVTLKT